jgi:type II secretory ATPase GspE/PulE/Tfp pilus assembly ATPase PilB-like protein
LVEILQLYAGLGFELRISHLFTSRGEILVVRLLDKKNEIGIQ